MNAPALGIHEDAPPLVEVRDLVRRYRLPRRTLFEPAPTFTALHGVSLTLRPGESLGIVGESGCGKSTLARTVMALETPQEGSVRFRGRDLFALSRGELRAERRHFQAIFQDPYGSLDPRYSVGRIVAEPIRSLEPEVDAAAREKRVHEALDQVGLPASAAQKYPHEFSGGQRQRIAIARALIVADEPVSALDVSVQAQVLNLMMDLQEELGLAYLFISHDLSVVRVITDRVCVMQAGRIVEEGASDAVFDSPAHDYTRTLLDAVPGRHRRARAGERVRADE